MKSFYRRGRRIFDLFLGCLVLLGVAWYAGAQETGETEAAAAKKDEIPKVTVIADRLNIRSGPSTNYEIMGQLQRGDVLPVRGVQGDWISFPLPASMPVWIHKDLVRDGEVLGDRVNLRAGPSTRHNRVGSVVRGDKLKTIEVRGDWLKIQPPASVLGWVHKDYVVDSEGGQIVPADLRIPADSGDAGQAAEAAESSAAEAAPAEADASRAAPPDPVAEVVISTPGDARVEAAAVEASAGDQADAQSATVESASEEDVPPPLLLDDELDVPIAEQQTSQPASREEEPPAVSGPAVTETVDPVSTEAGQNVSSPQEASASVPPGGLVFSPIVESAQAKAAENEQAAIDRRRFVDSVMRENGEVPENLEPIDLKASPLSWPTQNEFRLLGNQARIQGRLKRAPIQNIPNLFILEKQYGTHWYPDCFVVAPKLDLAKYLGREIRVQGKRLFVEDWSRPLLQADEVATTWK
jgi:uncharacterized protein YraI